MTTPFLSLRTGIRRAIGLPHLGEGGHGDGGCRKKKYAHQEGGAQDKGRKSGPGNKKNAFLI